MLTCEGSGRGVNEVGETPDQGKLERRFSECGDGNEGLLFAIIVITTNNLAAEPVAHLTTTHLSP